MGAEMELFNSPVPDMAPPRRQHVLLTADTLGGVWTYALELSRVLCMRGHDVTLATMGSLPDGRQRREAAAIPGLTLYSRNYKLLWMNDAWEDVRAAGDWLLGIAARVKPTVVHLNDLGHGCLPWNLPVLTVGHSCVLSWWRAVHGVPAPPAWEAYRTRVRKTLCASDIVVAPTRTMLGELESCYGPLHSARVIPNGCSNEIGGARVKAPLIFCAGRIWDEAKNIRVLPPVAEQIEWPIYVAGSHEHPDGKRVEMANLHLLGNLAHGEMQRWFARASIYVSPVRYEPFGLSVLEAAHARCALLLGDIPSLREVWGDAAWFVPPDDPDAIAWALRRLVRNDELRVEYGERAHRRATRYTPDAMAEAYENAYAQIAQSHPASRERDLRLWRGP